ncbi:MAG: M28 family peptidase [Clostridiales bacterium]|nr:M28 family peptidase [Clostridiales bacterium]
MSNEEQTIEKAENTVPQTDAPEQTQGDNSVAQQSVEQPVEAQAQQADSTPEPNSEPESEKTDEATQETQESAQSGEAEKVTPKEEADTPTEDKSDKPNDAQKPAKKASKKSDGGKIDLGSNKLFKALYYPILAVFVALMFIFSVIDGSYGYSPNAYDAEYYANVNASIAYLAENPRSAMSQSSTGNNAIGITAARDHIVDTLTSGGFNEKPEQKTDDDLDEVDGEITTDTEWYVNDANVYLPTVTTQTSTLTAALQQNMGLSDYLVGTEITNIIAAIPCNKDNAGAIIITVRYDSRPDSTGAGANAAFVANVLHTLNLYVKNQTSFENDVVVVFTEDLDNSYGANAFFDAFKGLNDVVSRAKAGISLEAYGNAGTLALTAYNTAGYDYISAYTGVSGSVLNSSVVSASLPSALVNEGAVTAFGDIPAVQVAVLGGLDKAESMLDSADNLSQAIVRQQAQFVKDYIDSFGNTSKSFSSEPDGNMVVFSYLDGGSITYNSIAAYVIGAVIILMIAGAIASMIVKKTFSVKRMFIAMGVQLLTVIATLACLVASYFVVTLMLTGFGVLPIHAIANIRYFNAGILIAAMIITLAASFGFTTLFKKLLKVTSSDTVRGTAMLFGITGAVMSFACPAYSFLTSWLGILMLVVLIVSALTHKQFKAKFGIGMDRLYLYAIPVAICLPIIMSSVVMTASLLPLALMPVLMTLFTGMLGVAVPYLDRTQVLLDKVAKKLPKRTVRVERVVTEQVEDRAKKGKFTEKTYKRVEKEKVAIGYKNYFGISVLAVLGIVVALFSGGFGVSFGKSITGYHDYQNAIYNDAIVYEWSKDESGTTTQSIVVEDLMAYKFIRYSLNDLKYEGGRYVKTVNYSTVVTNEPNITRDASGDNAVYNVTTFDGALSYVTLTIPSASSITKITVKEASKADSGYKGYVYEFDNESKITLRLPYGFGNFEMEIEGASPTRFEYDEYRSVAPLSSNTPLSNVDEWNTVVADYVGTDVGNNLSGGIVVKRTFSL